MWLKSTVISLLVLTPLSAHETWMTPSAFSARAGDTIRLDVTSGMAFPDLESPIATDRVATAGCRIGPDRAEVSTIEASDKSLVLTHAFRKDGVATFWLELKPREIALSDDEVEEYLDEIGATEEVRTTWAGRKGRVAWKETYTKHAKTFVAIGDAREDRSWQLGVGLGLEIVPVTSPLAAAVGREFGITLLADGKPMSGMPVGLLVEGAQDRAFRTTNADGLATFQIGKGGRAMIFAVRLRPAGDGAAWESDFTTLTLDITRPQ